MHEFKIVYCEPCGLEGMAKSLEKVIRQMMPEMKESKEANFVYQPVATEEEKGTCDLFFRGELVYSKKTEGRIASVEKVNLLLSKIRAILAK